LPIYATETQEKQREKIDSSCVVDRNQNEMIDVFEELLGNFSSHFTASRYFG